RHVREGSTQLNAVDEVGHKLNRTAAACGIRRHAEVRRKNDNAVALAKRHRKERTRALAAQTPKETKPDISLPPVYEINNNSSANRSTAIEEQSITIDDVIHILKDLKKHYHASNQSRIALEEKQNENTMLREHVGELEKQLAKTEKQLTTIQEDYQTFVQIMDRARKMTVLDDQGAMKAPAFKMDKNGNLEQLAHGTN